ncbi:MAG TPA: ABC transporter ATP-binding protein [Porticoccaceae bacterium]|nr:ABC transporter ATP-binding protein [Porticoccaceae bacterium]HCO58981.1 ABC transporter ATP-binding protein [Porticoccaceae bacterium]
MILLDGVEFSRGGRQLLIDASLRVHAGQKVGLVGANGSGKSSLFLLMQGLAQVDRGECSVPRDWRIASVEQETPALSLSVLEHTIDGDRAYRELENQRQVAEAAGGETLAQWHHDFETMDAYSMPARAARLLAGLGFNEAAQARPVSSFSGGWRMRINLARALLQPSELLLLDEPTNHLDLDAVVWLEAWLARYQGTLLLISHDREFLDRVVGVIAHIDQQCINTYQGDYSSFERQRGERLMQQQSLYDKQARQRVHLQQFVDRFRAKASKARQAQSRIKALEKLQAAAPVYMDSAYHFRFLEPEGVSSPLISFDDVRAGYGDVTVLDNIQLNLQPGSRIGLLGRNGAGKSTLIKLLAGILRPQSGRIERGGKLAVAYFDQQQLEALDMSASPMLHLQRLDSRLSEQACRDFLGNFGFGGDRVFDAVAPFSGGEKTRLALALLVWQKPNLLLLDEPTNHLDMDMREALVMALQDFSGAMVLVSHDRHLLRTVVDDLYLVENGGVEAFKGDLDDYQSLQLRGFTSGATTNNEGRDAGQGEQILGRSRQERQERKRLEAAFRQQTSAQRKQLLKLERDMQKEQARLDGLGERLAEPELYEEAHKQRLNELSRAHGETRARLDNLELEWLELSEELERQTKEFEQG